MVPAGRLRIVGEWTTSDGRQRCRIEPESVEAAFPSDGTRALRRLLLGAILAGRLRVPAPESRWGMPVSLEVAAEVLRG
jgi:hypothetical protein